MQTSDPNEVPKTLALKKKIKNNVFSKIFDQNLKIFGQNTFTIDPNILYFISTNNEKNFCAFSEYFSDTDYHGHHLLRSPAFLL